jgi:hypothetical protein
MFFKIVDWHLLTTLDELYDIIDLLINFDQGLYEFKRRPPSMLKNTALYNLLDFFIVNILVYKRKENGIIFFF